MLHDFDEEHGGYDNGNGDRGGPCNGEGIMSYGRHKDQWSTCSVKDFTGWYNKENWGAWCLKGKISFQGDGTMVLI